MMKKLICEACGHVFDESDTEWLEERDTGEGGYGGLICATAICPECHSEALSDAVECPICGELHSEEDDDLICDECRKRIEDLWKDLLGKLEDGADECEVARYIAEVLA